MRTDISKRIIALACALTMVLATLMTGCGKSAKIDVGYYKLLSVEEGDTKVKGKELKDYGLENASMVADGQGGVIFIFFYSTYNGEVKASDGIIETDFGDVAYSVDGDEVTLSDENMTMTFEKEY